MKDLVSLRGVFALILLGIIAVGFSLTITEIPFGVPNMKVGTHYLQGPQITL